MFALGDPYLPVSLGSGLIAAFVAGMLFGTVLGGDTGEITIFADEAGALLDGVTFLFFGAVLLGPTSTSRGRWPSTPPSG